MIIRKRFLLACSWTIKTNPQSLPAPGTSLVHPPKTESQHLTQAQSLKLERTILLKKIATRPNRHAPKRSRMYFASILLEKWEGETDKTALENLLISAESLATPLSRGRKKMEDPCLAACLHACLLACLGCVR